MAPTMSRSEIAHTLAEIVRTETAGSPLTDRLAAMNAAFDSDLEFFREHGFGAVGYLPGQREEFRMKSFRGALIATSGATIRKSEQARIERQFEAAGGFGLSEADKQRRLGHVAVRNYASCRRNERSHGARGKRPARRLTAATLTRRRFCASIGTWKASQPGGR